MAKDVDFKDFSVVHEEEEFEEKNLSQVFRSHGKRSGSHKNSRTQSFSNSQNDRTLKSTSGASKKAKKKQTNLRGAQEQSEKSKILSN
jgi:hypothetical protein